MFGLGKRQVAPVRVDEEAQAAIQEAERILFPSAQIPKRLVAPERQQTYEELARQLGFQPVELVRAQLLAFFEQEGIKLYNYGEVSAWLTAKKKQAGASHWCWRPLRPKDVTKDYYWGWEGIAWKDGFYNPGDNECFPYQRLVPIHALEKVAKIKAVFGDDVKFFVSDYASPKADPFIMVRPSGFVRSEFDQYFLVFDCWNEPGFGE